MRYLYPPLIIISIVFNLTCSQNDKNKASYALLGDPLGKWVLYESNVLVFIPESEPPACNKRALMINLHGCTMSKESMRDLAQWDSVAIRYGMIVAIPQVPNGGRTYPPNWWGCWDYSVSASRDSGHAGYIISLARRLLNDGNLNIDPNQVYVSGFSSGAAMSAVLACLAPDVFAGIGICAGCSIDSEELKWVGGFVQERVNICLDMADSNQSYLATQLTSVFIGSNDTMVNPFEGPLSAEIMSNIYQQFPNGPLETRVSSIVGNTGHTWPTYFPLNYTEFLTQFLFANNKRCNCN